VSFLICVADDLDAPTTSRYADISLEERKSTMICCGFESSMFTHDAVVSTMTKRGTNRSGPPMEELSMTRTWRFFTWRFFLAFCCGFAIGSALADDQGAASTPIASSPNKPAHIVKVTDPQTVGLTSAPGATGDGVTDDWEAFQLAEGMNASGVCTYKQPTLVIVPPATASGAIASYRISQAIRICPYVTLRVEANSTQIKFTGDASGTDYTGAHGTTTWPLNGAILTGYLVAGSTNPTYATAATISPGTTSVTLSTPSGAKDFVVGDMATIETTSLYDVSRSTEPTLQKIVIIKSQSASTGILTFSPAVDFTSSSVQVRRLTNGAGTADWPTISWSTVPAFATHDCGVLGGAWIASKVDPSAQPFMAGDAFTDCTIAPDYVSAAFGVGYGNAIQNSHISVRREDIVRVALEPAYQSNNNIIDLGEVNMRGMPLGARPTNFDLAFDEGSHNNVLHVGTLTNRNPEQAIVTLTGTPNATGGDMVTVSVFTPGVRKALVNASGKGYGVSKTGTMSWIGRGCPRPPVLAVATTPSGNIGKVTGIVRPGACVTAPSTSATSWLPGNGLEPGNGAASFDLTMTLSYTAKYTGVPGDTLSKLASGVAAALNATPGFMGAGYTAISLGPAVQVYNSSPTIPFYMPEGATNSVRWTPGYHSVLFLSNASSNRVNIDSVIANIISGYTVRIKHEMLHGATPSTNNNFVTVRKSTIIYEFGNAIIDGPNANANVVSGGSYFGSIFQNNTFQIGFRAGSRNSFSEVRSYAPGGRPSCDIADMSNALVGVYSPVAPPNGGPSRCRRERVTSGGEN